MREIYLTTTGNYRYQNRIAGYLKRHGYTLRSTRLDTLIMQIPGDFFEGHKIAKEAMEYAKHPSTCREVLEMLREGKCPYLFEM